MKALLLAAGMGTRLRPITNHTPKCLVKIGNRPILDYWICHLIEVVKCEKIFINCHHLSDQVISYVSFHKYRKWVQLVYEDELLDTAGTVNGLIDDLGKTFLIIHADNFISGSLNKFASSNWASKNNYLKALCLKKERVQDYGIFTIDDNNLVIGFEEKPIKSESKIANGAIYLANENFFNYVKKDGIAGNLSNDVIPKIYKYMEIHLFDGQLFDIGTVDELQLVKDKLKNGEISAWEEK